jgi:hypothetical protein
VRVMVQKLAGRMQNIATGESESLEDHDVVHLRHGSKYLARTGSQT